LSAIHRLMPSENLIYLADTQHTPYGIRSNAFIEDRVDAIAKFLMTQNVKLIVVACNTATAAAINSLRSQYDIPIVGLEPAIKPAIESSQKKVIGVLATRATLESEKYRLLRSRFEDQATIIEKASSYFVELVESAPIIDEKALQKIRLELQPFIDAGIDSLVLGCTHFPFLTRAIYQILGPKVTLFESGMPVAKQVERQLAGQLNEATTPGWTRFYSSAPQVALPAFHRLINESVTVEPF